MGFKKMTRQKYPPRLWSLVGYPRSGKSTFAARLKGPMVVIDADHRFQEVLELANDEVYELSETCSDNVDPNQITKLLNQNMPGSGVETIVVDSLTAIITPLVVQAMVDHDAGRERNLSAAFRNKALAMRQIQDAVTRWGSDVLWIYHLQDARDARAKEITRATISETELARLSRSINVQLEVVLDEANNRRGIRVVWARRGRSGMTIWDESGSWEGMPEKIESSIYDGLTADEQDRIEKSTPDTFPNPETAISWAVEQGAFTTIAKAKKAYNECKKNTKPTNAREMAQFWVDEVHARLLTMGSGEAAPEEPEEVAAAADDEGSDDDCPF
jgi:adenosyl cobinamide kinase/adenosyl cobinamide phosphate guanylyltransferase